MANRALQWINLQEGHRSEQLSEVDPFLGYMAASSPCEGSAVPEIQV